MPECEECSPNLEISSERIFKCLKHIEVKYFEES